MKDRPILLLAIAQTLIWACIYYSFPALLLHWEASLGWSRADLTAAVTLAIFMSAFNICYISHAFPTTEIQREGF